MIKSSFKKTKQVKKTTGKKGFRHIRDNVKAHTSLPPKVEGQIRCHLRLSVPEIVWFVGSPPDVSAVRVRWWGEETEAIFLPLDKRKNRNYGGTGTVARYAIRSGPKQFAAYLSDMKTLTLDVLSGPSRVTVGKCVLKDLQALSPSTPLSGVYPAFSANEEKIAELKVALKLESLMASYDSNQSVDAPSEVRQSAESLRPVKLSAVPSSKPRVHDDSHDPFVSPVARPNSKAESRSSGLQGVDHSYYSHASIVYERPTRDVGLDAPAKSALYQLDLGSRPGSDLISALLDRGTKLKKAMVVSSMEETLKPSLSNPDVSTISQSDVPVNASLRRTSSTGDLFRALLSDQPRYQSLDGQPRPQSLDETDMHSKAVELVLGSAVTNRELANLRAVLEGRSPSSTLSDDQSTLTEIGDPARDDSILDELFYSKTAHDTDSTLSDDDVTADDIDVTLRTKKRHPSLESPGNKRPPSRDVTPRGSRDNTPTRSRDSRRSSLDDDQASRVSFDMPLSSDDEAIKTKRLTDGLSVERLTLLGRVHKARVVIETLTLVEDTSARKVGKPPRPDQGRNSGSTYFVEYQFPVNATSRDRNQNCKATEVMRVASKRIADGAISFSHRSMFPVSFGGDSVEQWWKSALVFKIYSRSTTQSVPSLLGSCSVSLKSLLQSDSLYVDRSLVVRSNNSDRLSMGKLRVCVELSSDNKDFANALAKTRLAEMKNPNIVPIGKKTPKKGMTEEKREFLPTASPAKAVPAPAPVIASEAPIRAPVVQSTSHTSVDEQGEAVTLHTLLMISEGRNITVNGTRPQFQPSTDGRPLQPPQPSTTGMSKRDMSTRNTYLVCRMFWLSDNVRTNVCWGTTDPKFQFSQVAPILITQSLLERMRNNVMVIEVWDKKSTSENDKLVGLVKLPLHQFYLSFREKRIMTSLLKSQYPVTAVEQFLPVVDPFSGRQFGQIHVLLAMGSHQQVSTTQRSKLDPSSAPADPNKPLNYLERHDLMSDGVRKASAGDSDLVQHLFEVVVEGVRDLDLEWGMVWGEADIFVQYHFPSQQGREPQARHVSPTLKPTRTTSTLCVPDPVFHDVTTHRLLLPQGTPVQREVLQACAGVGGGVGGVPFELWCRQYTPNVRDQVMAKTTLPLARLCALITMHKPGQPSVQTFSLPLQPCMGEGVENESKPKIGLLDVTLTYKPSSFVSRSDLAVSKNLTSSQVCLSVGIIRASGLKAAADTLARVNSSLQYPSEVGVNAYCRIKLSFLSKEDERLTKTVARSFAPELCHYLDFPCPLLWCEAGSEALCLAEILESADVCVEVWHQIPGSQNDCEVAGGSDDVIGRKLIATFSDTLLGSVTVPLKPLLYKKTGIKGWYSVHLPAIGWSRDGSAHSSGSSNQLLERVVGGVELSIKFAHQEDRERVLHAGRSVGWIQETQVEEEWESLDDSRTSHHQVTVHVDHLCFPLVNALSAGKTTIDKSTACYVRYKFYDKAAVCSKLHLLSPDEPVVRVSLDHRKVARVQASSPFHWYLREERLELQVWVTTSADGSQRRPRHRDKLIGSAYVDMTPLVSPSSRQHRVSDIFALYKPGTSSLLGACVRCHISLQPDTRLESTRYQSMEQTRDDIDDSTSSDECMLSEDEVQVYGKGRKSPKKERSLPNEETTFPCLISIERALHLTEITDSKTGVSVSPSAYVSYQSAESHTPTYTHIVTERVSPGWNHQQQTRLLKSLLEGEDKTLVLKVWHRTQPGATEPDVTEDRVIGFVTVDLSPITYGLQQLCGWYNIIDFLGQCQGQIKISVIPQGRLEVKEGKVKDQPATQTHGPGYAFSTVATYPTFPSHLARFTEQSVTLAPPERSGQNQNQVEDREPASRSMLFRTLRSNLDELDQINSKLTSRLTRAPPSGLVLQSETERSVTNPISELSTLREVERSSEASLTPPTKDQTLAQSAIEDALSRARRLLQIGGFSPAEEEGFSPAEVGGLSPTQESESSENSTRNNNNSSARHSPPVAIETHLHDDDADESTAKFASSTKLLHSDDSETDESESENEDFLSRHFRDEEQDEYEESEVDESSVVVPRPLNNISCMTFSNALDESWRSVESYGGPRDFHELARASMRDSEQPDSPKLRRSDEGVHCNRQLRYQSRGKGGAVVAESETTPRSSPGPDIEETLNGSRGISGIDCFPESPRDHEVQAESERELEESVKTPEPFEFRSEQSDQKIEEDEGESVSGESDAENSDESESEGSGSEEADMDHSEVSEKEHTGSGRANTEYSEKSECESVHSDKHDTDHPDKNENESVHSEIRDVDNSGRNESESDHSDHPAPDQSEDPEAKNGSPYEPPNSGDSGSNNVTDSETTAVVLPERQKLDTDDKQDTDEIENNNENVQPKIVETDRRSSRSDNEEIVPEPNRITQQENKKNKEERTHTVPPKVTVPDYFLPAEDLAKSMAALRMVTALQSKPQKQVEDPRLKQRAAMMRQYMERIPPQPAPRDDVISPVKQGTLARQAKPLPTAQEAKRIARIFSSRFAKNDL